jgi:hypothetical protein
MRLEINQERRYIMWKGLKYRMATYRPGPLFVYGGLVVVFASGGGLIVLFGTIMSGHRLLAACGLAATAIWFVLTQVWLAMILSN